MSRGQVWGRRVALLLVMVGCAWAVRFVMLQINDRRFAAQRLHPGETIAPRRGSYSDNR